MSNKGLSKADREIASQGFHEDEETRNARKLFGVTSQNLSSVSNTLPESSDKDVRQRHQRGRSAGSRPPKVENKEGETNFNINEDDEDEEEEYDYDDMAPGANWDRNLPSEAVSNKTALRWSGFDWKPHKSMFLRGPGNWISYKEDILIQLRAIGYRPRINLTPLDETKFAGIVQATTTPEARALIRGLTKGSQMMRVFESSYQQVGAAQQESAYEELSKLRYKGGCPLKYVTDFKCCVSNLSVVGGKCCEWALTKQIMVKISICRVARIILSEVGECRSV